MGQFAEVLHMGPRDVERLEVDEFNALSDYLARREQELRREGG